MQLSHAGRQTRREATGLPVVGASTRQCSYFRQSVRALDEAGIQTVIAGFADAAWRAREAGFDGVQVHGAHGYLVHQFLSPWTNTRTDRWGERPLLLLEIIRAIRRRCGEEFPLLVKLSAADDAPVPLRVTDTIDTVKRLEELEIDAVEISYGSMEYALSIIRGAMPIELAMQINPLFSRYPAVVQWLWKKLALPGYKTKTQPYREAYNLEAAAQIKRATSLPVIPVGGFRRLESMVAALTEYGLDAVSLCRPLICEPDWPAKLRRGESERSRCTNCNLCTIHVDGREPVRCYSCSSQ